MINLNQRKKFAYFVKIYIREQIQWVICHIVDDDLSHSEHRARKRLIRTSIDMLEDLGFSVDGDMSEIIDNLQYNKDDEN